MALPLPPPYSQPIPNNPFYSPEESNVCTQSGVLTLGAGLDVDYATGTLAVAGGGVGTVQQVGTGAGLTGGPITVTGTIALAPLSPSSAGSYTNPTALDVDAYGRITSVTNGAANVPAAAYNALGVILAGTGVGSYSALAPGGLNQVLTADPLSPLGVKWEYTIPDGVTQITGTLPVFISNPSGPTADVSVAVASLASTGVVQLNDSVASTSTTEAATPNAVKTAYDLAGAAVPNSAFNAKGDIIVGTGNDTYGNFSSGTNGQIIVADSAETFGMKWVDNTPDGVLGITGTAPVIVDNTDPANPVVGIDAASTTAAGAVQLSDDTNSTSTTEAATINAVRVIGDVAFGAQGTADQAILDAAAAQATADAAVPNASFTAAGELLVGSGAGTYTALPAGGANTILSSDGLGNLSWVADSAGDVTGVTGTAPIVVDNTDPANPIVGIDTATSTTFGTVLGCTTEFNTYIGCNAGHPDGTSGNIAIGDSALGHCTGYGNIIDSLAIGYCTLQYMADGANNIALGNKAMQSATGGSFNIAIGENSLNALTLGGSNVAVGGLAGWCLVDGSSNVAVGEAALACSTFVSDSTAIGTRALFNAQGNRNTAIGWLAGCDLTSGSCNIIVGSYTGVAAPINETGSNHVVLSDGDGVVRLTTNGSGALSFDGTDYGTAGQVLKSAGTGAAPAWSSALYGAFSDSTIQTNIGGASGNPVDLNTASSSNGFSIVSGSQITATTAGVYNIQISLQIEKTDSGTDSVEVWFKKNGTDIANSNTNIELSGNGVKQLFALNLVESLTAGQYLEVWWYSADANVQLVAVVAGTRPAIPSAIVTIVPVGA